MGRASKPSLCNDSVLDMAELPKDPKGAELEDWVSAHLASRGCYIEASITERSPDEILELDVVWTDYRKTPEERHPVEVKSGKWGMHDVFKFYGWTRYLGLEPGQFIHTQPCEHEDASLAHVQEGTQIVLVHVANIESSDEQFNTFGLPEPALAWLPSLWRFSFWARRRLVRTLGVAVELAVCPETAKAAKQYLKLVNDAVFFMPDVRDRIEALIATHLSHKQLGKSAAHEITTKKVELENPPDSQAFTDALYSGLCFPVQACLYVEHRARLYIMKAVVDYWLAMERGELKEHDRWVILMNGKRVASQPVGITAAMRAGLTKLSAAKSFRLFPVFWQTLLWSWGGFLCKDRLEEEFAALEKETGVPVNEIPLALTAFDEIFPLHRGWFREPYGDDRRLLILMPAAMRGLGAHRRRISKGKEEFKDLGFGELTTARMVTDNNALATLLGCAKEGLVK